MTMLKSFAVTLLMLLPMTAAIADEGKDESGKDKEHLKNEYSERYGPYL